MRRRTFLRLLAASSALPALTLGGCAEDHATDFDDLHGDEASPDRRAAALYTDFDAPSATPVAVEYAVSAISAATVDVQLAAVVADNVFLEALGLADLIPQLDANVLATNPHFTHAESTRNGLAIVDVRADAVDVDFIHVDDVTSPDGRV